MCGNVILKIGAYKSYIIFPVLGENTTLTHYPLVNRHSELAANIFYII